MRRLFRGWPRDRRQAQAGTTLVELLVSLVIMGMALVLVVGTFSTGLLDATITKRNTTVQAVIQYELDKISADHDANAQDYSECFATENLNAPVVVGNYQDDCPSPSGQFTLRADVQQSQDPPPTPTSQVWTVTVVTWPDQRPVGGSISLIKATW